MTKTKMVTAVRSMTLEDLDAIFYIDHKIREMGKAITYAHITTERIFTINRHVGRLAKPVSYVDLITGDVSELLELGLVAEVEGHVRGFILGSVGRDERNAVKNGRILILGVHPDYQRQGIATNLVDGICNKFLSEGIRTVRIKIDQRDKDMLAFCEGIGFDVGHLIEYTRRL
jgi:ribosomal protein S18 acetylase RimI-like enzyme